MHATYKYYFVTDWSKYGTTTGMVVAEAAIVNKGQTTSYDEERNESMSLE